MHIIFQGLQHRSQLHFQEQSSQVAAISTESLQQIAASLIKRRHKSWTPTCECSTEYTQSHYISQSDYIPVWYISLQMIILTAPTHQISANGCNRSQIPSRSQSSGSTQSLISTQVAARAVFSSLQYAVSNTFNTQHILQRRQCQQGRTHSSMVTAGVAGRSTGRSFQSLYNSVFTISTQMYESTAFTGLQAVWEHSSTGLHAVWEHSSRRNQIDYCYSNKLRFMELIV